MYVRERLHVCVLVCVCVCACACRHACGRVHMRACEGAHVPVYVGV